MRFMKLFSPCGDAEPGGMLRPTSVIALLSAAPSGVSGPTIAITIAMPFSRAPAAWIPCAIFPRFWDGPVAGEEPIGG